MTGTEIVIPDAIEQELTPSEVRAYRQQMLVDPGASLPRAQCDEFYRLFRSGYSCRVISQDRGVPLGLVVRARIHEGWDALYNEHMQQLLQQARGRARQAHLETVGTVQLQLTAARQLMQDILAAYLERGDMKLLPDVVQNRLTDVTYLQQLVDLLFKLQGISAEGGEGQKAAGRAQPAVQVQVNVGGDGKTKVTAVEEAEDILERADRELAGGKR